jgi:hypothetical protein
VALTGYGTRLELAIAARLSVSEIYPVTLADIDGQPRRAASARGATGSRRPN